MSLHTCKSGTGALGEKKENQMKEANFRTKSWSILPTSLSLDGFIQSRKCWIKHSYLTHFYLSLLDSCHKSFKF